MEQFGVYTDGFAPALLAHTVQMNDGYAVADFEHVGLGCGFYRRRLNLGFLSAASSFSSKVQTAS
jgi:hypothetical protein